MGTMLVRDAFNQVVNANIEQVGDTSFPSMQIAPQFRRSFTQRLVDGNDDYHLNIDGSVTPVNFEFKIPVGEVWQINKMILHIEDTGTFKVGGWGAQGTALALGLDVELVFANDSFVVPIIEYPFKSISDILGMGIDTNYNAFGSGINALTASWNLLEIGDPFKLSGDNVDAIRVRVNDNLSFLDNQYVTIQGVVLQENPDEGGQG